MDRFQEVADRVAAMGPAIVAALVQHGLRVRALARREVEAAQRRLVAFSESKALTTGREPAGIVAILLPANAALAAPLLTIGAALLAGNRVFVRFPRRTAWLRSLFDALLEPFGGAVTVVDSSGPDFLRRSLGHGGADVTMAYGDDTWALEYEELARRSPGRFIFEGPGKDPFLVLSGADLDKAARDAVRGALYNGGQACVSPERFYVQQSLVEPFLDRVLSRVERIVLGPSDAAETDLGVFTNPEIVNRFVRQVEEALAKGARLVWPRSPEEIMRVLPDGRGTFLSPVVLRDVHHGMLIMREETFGPAIPVHAVSTVDEAIDLAEDSPYGLAASVFGGSANVAPRLRQSHGMVFEGEIWLDFYDREPLGPVGGFRRSGWVWERRGRAFIRREGPRRLLHEFSTPRSSTIDLDDDAGPA